MTKENWKDIGKIVLMSIVLGFVAGVIASNIELAKTNKQLETELVETQEQLNISNDHLKQINMRNEAIYYINQLEQQGTNEADE